MIKRQRFICCSLTVLLGLALSGCQHSGVRISGHFDHGGKMLFLDEITPESVVTKDTILLVNGSFDYRFKPENEGIFRLRVNDTSHLSFVAGGNDRLTFSGDARDLSRSYRVTGNISSEMLWESNRRIREMYAVTDSLSRIFLQAKQADSLWAVSPALDSCYYAHFLSCKSALAALIEKHPSELAALPIFFQQIGVNRFFSEEKDSALYLMMKKELSAAHPDNPHIKALQEKEIYE